MSKIKFPLIIAFASGFLSLYAEVIWMRLMAYSFSQTARINSTVLCVFLVGIAIGSKTGKNFCNAYQKNPSYLYSCISGAFLLSFFTDISSFSLGLIPTFFGILLIFISAYSKAIILPIAHHLYSSEIKSDNLGKSISTVYISNIIGSSIAPLLLCFLFLEYLSTQACFLMLAFLSLAISIISSVKNPNKFFIFPFPNKITHIPTKFIKILFVSALPLFMMVNIKYPTFILKNIFENNSIHTKTSTPRKFIESRHGVITLAKSKSPDSDYIFSGLVYDGRINHHLENNPNMLERAYILPAMHKNPKKILVIGLSSGSWLKVLSAISGVTKIDVIEINPSYITVVKDNPIYHNTLTDPRIHFHFQDARQYLRKSPEKYDLIVGNLSFYWRSYATTLISTESIALMKSRLEINGILALNTTSCMDILYTMSQHFQFSYLYGHNFAYGSDQDIKANINDGGFSRIMAMTNPDNTPFIAPENRRWVTHYLNKRVYSVNEVIKIGNYSPHVITDYNMFTEFKEVNQHKTIE